MNAQEEKNPPSLETKEPVQKEGEGAGGQRPRSPHNITFD